MAVSIPVGGEASPPKNGAVADFQLGSNPLDENQSGPGVDAETRTSQPWYAEMRTGGLSEPGLGKLRLPGDPPR